FFFSSRRRHTRSYGDWSSDVCSSDLAFSTPCSKAQSKCSAASTATSFFLARPSTPSSPPSGLTSTASLAPAKSPAWPPSRLCTRSEERRVGKECRCRRVADEEKKKVK